MSSSIKEDTNKCSVCGKPIWDSKGSTGKVDLCTCSIDVRSRDQQAIEDKLDTIASYLEDIKYYVSKLSN